MLAADKRRKEPRAVRRPGPEVEPQSGLSGTPETGMTARGLSGFLDMAHMAGAVRRNG